LSIKKEIQQIFLESSSIIESSQFLSEDIENTVNIISSSFRKGKKLVIFGNGGSAADAQHIAAELIGRFQMKRDSLPAIALTTDSSILTSIGNDFSFNDIFSRQVEGLVNSGDVVLGISTSGNSINIINGLKSAKSKNAKTISILGNNGGKIKNFSDVSIIVNSSSTPRIQEVHRIIYHIICEHIEKKLSKK
jgi:D-sedoheptulose 7-phosphate isomerase|tara:strand:- start:307 stop:882 length:576 start_codon:yes stop_codon:yes gene_type:complete